MPTKPNRNGQQEYVPAGNGDASGEYAGESGSNKNFESFKQPNTFQEFTKPTAKQSKDNLLSAITFKMGSRSINGNKLKKQLADADIEPRYSNLVANFYRKGWVWLSISKNNQSKFSSYNDTVSIGQSGFNDDKNYEKGEVFMHETGHAIDYSYGSNMTYSYKYISKKYNMTLQDSMFQELEKFKDVEEFNKLKSEIYNYRASQEPDNIKQSRKLLAQIEDELIPHYIARSRIATKFDEEAEFSIFELSQKVLNKEIDVETFSSIRDEHCKKRDNAIKTLYKDNSTYQKLQNDKNKLTTEIYYYEEQNAMFKYFGSLSDMIQATIGKNLCGGHGAGYFKNDKLRAGTECFAEIFGAKTTNKKSYEVLKKYIPRTIEIFDEIIGVIENE